MKIYGYSKSQVDDEGLLEMDEISIQTSPDKLRKIAQFLNKCADLMEEHKEKFGHEHLSHQYDDWDDNFSDIIVAR